MSESIIGHLDYKKLGQFSYHIDNVVVDVYVDDLVENKSTSYWDWHFYGYIKESYKIHSTNPLSSTYTLGGGEEIDTTHFFTFRSDIEPNLIKMVYLKSSDKFRKNHIKIIKTSPWIQGAEFEMVNLVFEGLEPHRMYNMDRILPIVRDKKINNIINE
jgi:hypothetical protein